MPLNASDIVPGIPLGRGVALIDSHPEGLFALYKPCRILSHPNSEGDRRRSLIQASWSQDRERYMWKDGKNFHRFYLLHRLDALTSGVILGCMDFNLARELKQQFSKQKVVKTYYALVSGSINESKFEWQDVLRKRRFRSDIRVAIDRGRGMTARTDVEVVQTKKNHPKLSLLRLNPRTGRTHQLRFQCAKRKFPIIGDTIYGDFSLNRYIQKATRYQRLFLHAYSIRIEWHWKQRKNYFQAESKVPEEFNELMDFKIP